MVALPRFEPTFETYVTIGSGVSLLVEAMRRSRIPRAGQLSNFELDLIQVGPAADAVSEFLRLFHAERRKVE